MRSGSDSTDPNAIKVAHPLPPDTAIATVIKSVSLAVIVAAGLLENACVIVTIMRDRKLHRAPYYYMINLSVADLLRSILCLPVVLATVLHSSAWRYGAAGCTLLAFTGTFLTFGALFALLFLALDRHLAVSHHRFYSRKFKGPFCLAIMLIGWAVAFTLAFPPVFGLGTYRFIPMEAQCALEHRFYRDNDTFGFMLIFIFILALIIFLYFRIFKYLRAHRKMRPILYQPARSDNWAFFGPGANAAAAANNLLNGFARAVTNPLTLGIPTQPHITGRYFNIPSHSSNERLTRIFVSVTFIFCVTWIPYVVVTFWYTLDESRSVPYLLVTIATWMTYLQVALLPLIYIIFHRPFRRAMSASANAYILREYPVD